MTVKANKGQICWIAQHHKVTISHRYQPLVGVHSRTVPQEPLSIGVFSVFEHCNPQTIRNLTE